MTPLNPWYTGPYLEKSPRFAFFKSYCVENVMAGVFAKNFGTLHIVKCERFIWYLDLVLELMG